MAYNKYKFYDYNSPYKDSKGITNARNSLLAVQAPTYNNSFKDQIEGIYGKIKNRQDFDYNPDNDAAYRQYADQYRALVGLAVAGNQAHAQQFTGGYGSTYAPEVARQGEALINANVEAAQPAFYQLAQNKYDMETEQLRNMYGAAADRRNAELEEFGRQADIYNDKYQRAADYYNMLEDRGYDRYMGNREFNYNQQQMNIEQDQANKEYKLEKYDTYYNLAGNKCADYNAKGDNKGMKAYLDGLVKAGKLTQYMADNLYKSNEYTPPKRRRSSKKGKTAYGDTPKNYGTITIRNGMGDIVETYPSPNEKDYNLTTALMQHIGMNQTNNGVISAIEQLPDDYDNDIRDWLSNYHVNGQNR